MLEKEEEQSEGAKDDPYSAEEELGGETREEVTEKEKTVNNQEHEYLSEDKWYGKWHPEFMVQLGKLRW